MQTMYKLIGTNSVQRLSDNACIPLVNGNRDYEEYKLWLSEGNIPEPEFTQEEIAQQELDKQLQEYIAFLNKTDKKVLPYYEFEDGDNSLEWYISERKKARDFIRANTSTL